MLRSLAVLMSALVAMSAQAQDVSKTGSEGQPAPAARSTKAKRKPAIASKAQPLESAPQAKPDARVAAPTSEEPPSCGMGEWISVDQPAPSATRFYDPAVAAASPQLAGWKAVPRVRKAGRCLRKYFIQVLSSSKEPWTVQDATLVGADGEILKVIDIQAYGNTKIGNINIIVAEKQKGVAEPDYTVVAFRLVGTDGRSAVIQNVKLP